MRAHALVGLALCSGCGSSTPLPPHTYSSDPLYAGSNRVQVDVAEDITRDECIALISQYSTMAGDDGQVSVHKPSVALAGQSAPWCLDNMDGEGARFNDELFE